MTPDALNGQVLSKSKYLAGLQCPKLLWVMCNEKARLPALEPALAFRFEQGHQVGELARTRFPDGIAVAWNCGREEALRQTQVALRERRPVFEAALTFGSCTTRADVLRPAGKRAWDLIEVKSSSKVKPEQLEDLAFQRYVYEGAGLALRRCFVLHVNTGYVRKGAVDPRALFTEVDVTAGVAALWPEVAGRVRRMLETLALAACPGATIGARCSSPHLCPLADACSDLLPQQSVLTLVSGSSRAYELLDRGILALKDVPESSELTPRQQIQVKAVKRGRAQIDRAAIGRFLSTLRYPLYLLDFETVATPIPLYKGCRPYQQIPFQYSMHVVDRPGAAPKHTSFLARTRKDPRPRLMTSLRDRLGSRGSIVAYHAPFERQQLEACARDFPAHAAWVTRAVRRMVDLRDPFRAFDYYHPDQDGSTSLKVVLPALTGRGYDDLPIADGEHAGRAFLEMTFGNPSPEEKATIRDQLLRYCRRDTKGLLWILDALRRLAGEASSRSVRRFSTPNTPCVAEGGCPIPPPRGK